MEKELELKLDTEIEQLEDRIAPGRPEIFLPTVAPCEHGAPLPAFVTCKGQG